jgi:hypothetical protein
MDGAREGEAWGLTRRLEDLKTWRLGDLEGAGAGEFGAPGWLIAEL